MPQSRQRIEIGVKRVFETYDVIVIGAGHAGCEAALACARLGEKTLVFANNLDTVAYCACNPSIGGTAKGQIVREIDALGGEMGICADKSLLQIRMLNGGKGPAVYSPRAQVDKHAYHFNMKLTLESTPNLTLRQGEAVSLIKEWEGFIVKTAVGLKYRADAVILCTGVYLKSKVIIGKTVLKSGPSGFASSDKLSSSLTKLGFELRRFKTGTPARVLKSSIDYSKTQEQKGENISPFSFLNEKTRNKQSCYLTYSTQKTKEIVIKNRDKSPSLRGVLGTGPRYCPSIEDKIIRFADKERHQIFLEPEGENTNEVYVQGVSSSMPAEIQKEIYHSIEGLENVVIMRDAYAIEYDCIDATLLTPSLMSKDIKGLFFAGQINGTSGYEEAAAQGLVAGINASRLLKNQPPFELTRESSYIGVLIDDITTKQTNEPYRMMTSRAEYRLLLRQDNADLRLTPTGKALGLVSQKRWNKYLNKSAEIEFLQKKLAEIVKPSKINDFLESKGESLLDKGATVKDLIKRSAVSAGELFVFLDNELYKDISREAFEQIDIDVKYEGYIAKQKEQIKQAEKSSQIALSGDIDYLAIKGLRKEAAQKLAKIRPLNIGQAERISGVSSADITVLLVYLSKARKGG